MPLIKNVHLISVQSWTYLDRKRYLTREEGGSRVMTREGTNVKQFLSPQAPEWKIHPAKERVVGTCCGNMLWGHVAGTCCGDVSQGQNHIYTNVPRTYFNDTTSLEKCQHTRWDVCLQHVHATFSCLCTCYHFVLVTCHCETLGEKLFLLNSRKMNSN